jgi:DNA-binding transcriptional LysR family regulator
MELRHLRYFVAVGEEQHYGRASRRLRGGTASVVPPDSGSRRRNRLQAFRSPATRVKLNPAGKLFLDDARRILQEVSDAAVRAGRVARGHSGTLRVGFTENSSWRGVVPDSFRRFRDRQPDAELQLRPAASLDQLDAIRSGRLDAGFVNFMPTADPELDQLTVADQYVELAVPKRHPLAKKKKLRLRDLVDIAFVWFPRWAAPGFYDQMMEACYRGGLKSPRIVQEGLNEATILSLVSTGLGVGWVLGSARWRSPGTVVILPVVDLNVTLPLALAWRRDNTSPLLASFIGEVGRLPDARALNKG